MAQQVSNDKPWIVTATGCVAVDATLNRFASFWPVWVFISLWTIAAACLLVWGLKVGKADALKKKFSEAPAFYVTALLIITPFAVSATNTLFSRLESKTALVKKDSSVVASVPKAIQTSPVQQRTELLAPSKGISPNRANKIRHAGPSKVVKPTLSASSAMTTLTQPQAPQQPARDTQDQPTGVAANNSQSMINSPGGMQAGRDIVAIGRLPTPARVLLPQDIAEARKILETSKGSIAIVAFPTGVPDDSEIAKFREAVFYALQAKEWNVWRARGYEFYVGSFNGYTELPYGPHGVGCHATDPNSDAAKVVVKALAALKLYCRGPSVMDGAGFSNPFTMYITVSTRIVPEQ